MSTITPTPNQATVAFAEANQDVHLPISEESTTLVPINGQKNDTEMTPLDQSTSEQPSLKRAFTKAKKEGEVLPPIGTQLKSIILGSWFNVLLIFVPLGIIAKALNWGDLPVFFLNFLAVIPLAKMLGFATEELALRTGQTLGGLLNATFGNAVELILGIVSLTNGLISVVQASILGSILGNLLLILGLCFFCGGLKYKEQRFNATAAGIAASLMNISVITLVLLSAFFYQLQVLSDGHIADKVLELSRGASILLLIMYGLYLVFQLKTHKYLYQDDLAVTDLAEHDEQPAISVWLAMFLLLIVTVFVAIAAEFLVGAIEGVSHQLGLSTTFVGFILLPVVGNAAEHLTAVTVAMKNKMELALGVALGSSIQIALLIGPILVLIGWIINQPLTLEFGVFETVTAFVSVFIVNSVIHDGNSNWLEGALLLCCYILVAIAHFFLPDPANGSTGGH